MFVEIYIGRYVYLAIQGYNLLGMLDAAVRSPALLLRRRRQEGEDGCGYIMSSVSSVSSQE